MSWVTYPGCFNVHWTFHSYLIKKSITLKLKPLKKGDNISIVAPSGPFNREHFLRGIKQLRHAGLKPHYRKDIFAKKDYLAGEDRRRIDEMNRAFQEDSPAILVARGGYGCQRVLPHLKPIKKPKIAMGSSDLTVLLIYLWQRYGIPSLYGPMVAPHLTDPKNVRRVVRALTDPVFLTGQKLPARKAIRPGSASGRLVGGCLALITSTLGTPWELKTDDTILFLEDTNEDPYCVDRMLTQLEQAGKFKNVRGIVFGTFRQKKVLFPSKIEAVIRDKFCKFQRPVLWGIRFGHCPDPLIIPFGGMGEIRGRQLLITEGILET